MLRWPNSTLYEGIADIAEDHPEAAALYADSEAWTYEDLLEEARSLAGGLTELKIGAGDRIAVWLGNRPEWIVTQLAASYLGADTVAVNTRYRRDELEHMLSDSGSSVLLTETSFLGREYLDMLASLVPELETTGPDEFDPDGFENLEHVVALEETDYPAVRRYDDLTNGAAGLPSPATDPEATLCIFYTSGTTGAPKGCPQTNRSLLNHSYQIGAHLGVSDRDVALGVMPFCGAFGYNHWVSALVHGGPLVVQTHFVPERTIELIDSYDVTYFSGIETMYLRAIETDGFNESKVDSVERGCVGFINGMDEEAFERIESVFGFPVVHIYGLSEGSSCVLVGEPSDPIEQRKRVGGPMVHPKEEEVRVVDPESGERLPPGEDGELCLRGYNVIDGYLNRPDTTAEAFDEEGWLHTGDLGMQDPENEQYFYYHSRLDDALRVRGFLVSPGDIERSIGRHPAVELAQVVGTSHPRHGQVPIGFVKRKSGGDVTESEIREFLADRVADFKVPEKIRFVDEFPRTEGPHGEKVQKTVLRERVKDLYEDCGGGP